MTWSACISYIDPSPTTPPDLVNAVKSGFKTKADAQAWATTEFSRQFRAPRAQGGLLPCWWCAWPDDKKEG